MKWVTENWFWIVVFVVFFAAHVFGHGGHGGGGRGGHRGHGTSSGDDEKRSAGHQH